MTLSKQIIRFILKTGSTINYKRLVNGKIIPVLCFHRVNDDIDKFYPAIKVSVFKEFCKYLNSNYNVIQFRDIESIKNKSKQKPYLIVSFDDGYYGYYENAIPILEELKLKSNMNVITDSLDKDESYQWHAFIDMFKEKTKEELIKIAKKCFFSIYNSKHLTFEENFALSFSDYYHQLTFEEQIELADKYLQKKHFKQTKMLSWDNVIEIHKLGHEIGSQGVTHTTFDKLSKEEIIRELSLAKEKIDKTIKDEINVFAYPAGEYNDEILKISHEVGYKFLLLNNNKYSKINNEGIYDRTLIYGKHQSKLQSQATGFYYNLQSLKHYFK